MALKTNAVTVTTAWTELSDGVAGNLNVLVEISYLSAEPVVLAVANAIGDLSPTSVGHVLDTGNAGAFSITLAVGEKLFARTIGVGSKSTPPVDSELIITKR